MDDGQKRPRDAIGAICAQPIHKIGADPLQNGLWAARNRDPTRSKRPRPASPAS